MIREMLTSAALFAVLLVSVPLSRSQALPNLPEISATSADEHLLKKVEPVYPALAKVARIKGKVVLKATISQTGAVADVRVRNGHPMLITAAVDAVKQWQYKPFMIDGHPAEVSTIISISFTLDISESDLKREQKAADLYFKQEDKCRELVNSKRYADAESACKEATKLSEKLPSERQNERRIAYELLGHSLLFQHKFSEALSAYQRELTIAQASLRPYEAELGYAYHDVGLTFLATGDLKQSRSYYESAVSTLQQAHDHIDSPFLKNNYSRTMKTVLQEYAALLRQLGDTTGAHAAELRAQSIQKRPTCKTTSGSISF